MEPCIDLSRRRHVLVALIADTHGVLDDGVAAAIAQCAVVVHAGDIGNATVLRTLRARHERVIAVRGNNDTPAKWPAKDARCLGALPAAARLRLPGGILAVVHGDRHNPAARRHARLRREFAGLRAVVYGHSHRLVCDDSRLPWVLNPGAAGRVRTGGGASCLLLLATAAGWQVSAQHGSLRTSPDHRPTRR